MEPVLLNSADGSGGTVCPATRFGGAGLPWRRNYLRSRRFGEETWADLPAQALCRAVGSVVGGLSCRDRAAPRLIATIGLHGGGYEFDEIVRGRLDAVGLGAQKAPGVTRVGALVFVYPCG